jgi:amino acid adenylation domain-containing protein
VLDVEDLREPAEPSANTADARDLAYVIYTSGSTGRPKGVLTERRAVHNRLCWMRDALAVGPHDVILHKTPYTFDVSVWELLLPPLTGARMVLLPPGAHREPGRVAECVRQYGLTLLHFVPSLLADFLDEAGSHATLRQVVVSGEALQPALAARFAERLPGVALHNLYGPTEAAVDVTHWRCGPADAPMPIGFPITGVQLSIADEQLRPVADGETGELCIGGVAVARGYLNRPELTAQCFVPDPDRPGERRYRTGDIASRRADGAYLYHGRRDDQVKLGGVRIELGEVENALAAVPGVTRAAAAVRSLDTTDVLVGWVVLTPGQDIDGVRARLREVLPAALVPTALVPVDRITMTRHGKADRAALPWPPPTDPTPDEPSVAGRLRGLWAGLLGRAPEPDTDFFAAGGTSLLGLRLATRLRADFGVRLELRELAEHPRFAALVDLVTPRIAAPEPARLPRLAAGARLPMSAAQRRMWFLQQLEPDSAAMNIVGGLRLTGPIDAATASRCLAALLAAHETLRTVFPADDDGPYADVRPVPRIALAVVDLSTVADQAKAVAAELQDNAAEPFNLERGPLVRARLLRLATDRHVLALALHHVITDGWSWSVLAADFLAAWAGRPLTTAPRFVEYAALERANDREAVSQLDFWRRTLADPPAGLRLPSAGSRGDTLSGAADWCPIRWPAGFVDRLGEVCARLRTTPFAVLLAGYAVVLARLSGQDDVVIAAPVANRGLVELESVVGCFLNTLPLRVRPRPDESFESLLDRVGESLLDAHAHSSVPFDRVVAAIDGSGDLRSALFQHLLVVQNTPPWSASEPGRRVDVVELPSQHTHYDLKFEVVTHRPGLPARLVHATAVLDADRARRLADQLARFLGGAVADPRQRWALIPLTDQSASPTSETR